MTDYLKALVLDIFYFYKQSCLVAKHGPADRKKNGEGKC